MKALFIAGSISLENLECRRTFAGRDYRGTKSVTVGGRICQRWDMMTPHTHGVTDPALFGEVFLSDVWNYCRNPFTSDYLQCYTTDPDMRSEACDVPMCGNINSYSKY